MAKLYPGFIVAWNVLGRLYKLSRLDSTTECIDIGVKISLWTENIILSDSSFIERYLQCTTNPCLVKEELYFLLFLSNKIISFNQEFSLKMKCGFFLLTQFKKIFPQREIWRVPMWIEILLFKWTFTWNKSTIPFKPVV